MTTRPTENPAHSDASLFAVLRPLRRGRPLTRLELADETGLGRKPIAQRVDDLIESGLVSEGPFTAPRRGRPASQVAFQPRSAQVLVAELGSTTVSVGIADLSGRLLHTEEDSLAYTLGPELILSRVEQMWDELISLLDPQERRLLGIGIGVVGPVDPTTNETIDLRVVSGWAGYPIGERLSAKASLPTWVDNDVNLMALGQSRTRSKSTSDIVFVKVDAGIGAGLVSHGQLHHGEGGVAGEIGHLRVSGAARPCWCGHHGCLATISSARAILNDAIEGTASGHSPALSKVATQDLTLSSIAAAARGGDNFSKDLLSRAGAALGEALGAVVTVFNPAEVIIGGSVAVAGSLLTDPLKRALIESAFPRSAEHVTVSVTPLSERIGLTGAALSAVDGLFTPEHMHRWLGRSSVSQ